MGWHVVEPNAAGRDDPVLGVMPPRFEAFQWHYYNFDLPAGAELLAENDAARQAYRLGERTWAVQFHPEVTRHMLEHWFVEGASELPDPVAIRRDTDLYLGHVERVRPPALQRVPRRRREGVGNRLRPVTYRRRPLLDRQVGTRRPLVP